MIPLVDEANAMCKALGKSVIFTLEVVPEFSVRSANWVTRYFFPIVERSRNIPTTLKWEWRLWWGGVERCGFGIFLIFDMVWVGRRGSGWEGVFYLEGNLLGLCTWLGGQTHVLYQFYPVKRSRVQLPFCRCCFLLVLSFPFFSSFLFFIFFLHFFLPFSFFLLFSSRRVDGVWRFWSV